MSLLWPRRREEARRNVKLLLSSVSLNAMQAQALAELAGKQPHDLKVALITNGADPYGTPTPEWALKNHEVFGSSGFQVETVDLRKFRGKLPDLEKLLTSQDVLWFGGGNTFYLRWLLKEVGADKLVVGLAESGKVYGGDSAGAILAGPTLKYFEAADDPHAAPELIKDGLHLTEFVVVPHMDNEKYGAIVQQINEQLKADKLTTVPLNDGQALVVNGSARIVL
ncbi:MAG TPA: Type 1 glutamine amidotransferase-like domain-containing protein [Candidatus Saccharimonadales bacterium]